MQLNFIFLQRLGAIAIYSPRPDATNTGADTDFNEITIAPINRVMRDARRYRGTSAIRNWRSLH